MQTEAELHDWEPLCVLQWRSLGTCFIGLVRDGTCDGLLPWLAVILVLPCNVSLCRWINQESALSRSSVGQCRGFQQPSVFRLTGGVRQQRLGDVRDLLWLCVIRLCSIVDGRHCTCQAEVHLALGMILQSRWFARRFMLCRTKHGLLCCGSPCHTTVYIDASPVLARCWRWPPDRLLHLEVSLRWWCVVLEM